MTSDDPRKVPQPEPTLTETDTPLTATHAVYQPPADVAETEALDASIDGTSASHYGANDPALYENTPADGEKPDGEQPE